MSAERARLFVALELPDGARAELTRWRDEFVRGIDGLRLVDPANLHATLCFIGWREVGEIEEIAAACESVPPRSLDALVLDEARWLPRRRPRVLAIAIADPDSELAAAQAELSAVLERGGFYTPEARPFFGHVTIARVGSGARVRALRLPPPAPVSLERARVVLYRSRLMRGGAQYEALS